MKRKLVMLFIGTLISLFIATTAIAAGCPVSVRLNNQPIYFADAPVIENNHCIVALRPLLEAMGASLSWDQTAGLATARLNESTVTITPGNSIVKVNDRDIRLPITPAGKNGVLMVPLRAMADIFNIRTEWDSTTATINLYTDSQLLADRNDLEADLVTLDILTVNDFHGALCASEKDPGAARLGKSLQAEKAKNPDGTLILSAGDMFQGSIDSNLLYGQSVIKVMNQIGFDAMTVGNHEFDWGLDILKRRASEARFPFFRPI
ncbi:MAG: stalk domain-containing protein [Syntrophomonadaceae bacterium]